MKRAVSPKPRNHAVALALTWDGARWPMQALQSKARAFLMKASPKKAMASSRQLAKLFARDEVDELRICWVPRLQGGTNVLAEPFVTSTGKRISFKAIKTMHFGDALGVIYRR